MDEFRFFPDYVTVIASGPFGGLYLIYHNEKCLAMEKDSPFDTREGMIKWMERFSKRDKSNQEPNLPFHQETPASSCKRRIHGVSYVEHRENQY